METGSDMVLEMLRRSYFAVDGLWFVLLEEDDGLERALELDERVWQVMPKIQARKARELLGVEERTPAALVRCMALKLAAEGHRYSVSSPNSEVAEIVISECPWRNVLLQSGRDQLGPAIADHICSTEAAVWAKEFSPADGPPVVACMGESLCHGDSYCRVSFRVAAEDETGD